MRKRTLLLAIIAAGVSGAAAFGWVTIRRGFKRAGQTVSNRNLRS